MDEQLKARLIGATVLVVLAVLLVPELLSGRKAGTGAVDAEQARGTKSYTITLGGGITEGTEALPGAGPESAGAAPAIAAPRPAPAAGSPEPAPAQVAANPPSASPAASSVEPQPEPEAVPEQRAATAVTPPAAPAAQPAQPKSAAKATGSGAYSVQVGAFGSSDTARRLVADLQRDGYGAYVAPLERKGKTLHRVRVGPAATRDEADRLAARLKNKGLPATVVSGG